MEKQSAKKQPSAYPFKPVLPFHVTLAKQVEVRDIVMDRHYSVSDMKVDKELLLALPVFDYSSWQEEIDSQVDNCGMELYKRQCRQGLAKPEDFYDDGKSGVDMGLIPSNVHESKRNAEQLNGVISSLAKEMGISESEELTSDLLLKRFQEHIAKVWNEQAAKAQQQSTLEVKQ